MTRSETDQPGQRHFTRLSARAWLIVLIFAVTVLCVGLGTGRVLTRHEVLAAEPAREMLAGLERGEWRMWIIPEFAGVPRTVKPPTTGWLIAGSMALFQSQAEWVARLPAAVAGVLTCLLVAWMTARYLGERAGVVAGLMQATCFYTLMQARLAEADMLLCFCVTAAMTCFVIWRVESEGRDFGFRISDFGLKTSPKSAQESASVPHSEIRDPHSAIASDRAEGPIPTIPSESKIQNPKSKIQNSESKILPLLFYFFAALSLLVKGVGPIFIFPACLAWFVLRRDWRGLKAFASPLGILLFLIVAGSWPVTAYLIYPDIAEVWRRETIGRAAGGMGGGEPWWFYTWNVPMLLLPWTPALLVGAFAAFRRGLHKTPLGAFLLCWFGAGFLLVSIFVWKHKHYILPALPPLTLVAAGGLLLYLRHQYQQTKPRYALAAWIWIVGCAAVIAGVLALVQQGPVHIALLVAVLMVGGLVVLRAEARRRPTFQIGAIFTTAALVCVGVNLLVIPHHDGYRDSADFGRRAGQKVPVEQTIYLVGLNEAHVAYYTRMPLARIDDPTPQTLPDSDSFFALTTRAQSRHLSSFATVEELDALESLRKRETDDDRLVLVRVTTRAN